MQTASRNRDPRFPVVERTATYSATPHR